MPLDQAPHMKLLHEICSLPTAPFIEDRVIQYARQFAIERKLKLTEDRFGNLLLELRGTKPKPSRWVFTAHMDHPGFMAEKMLHHAASHLPGLCPGGISDRAKG